jgi:hypothetical protein
LGDSGRKNRAQPVKMLGKEHTIMKNLQLLIMIKPENQFTSIAA